MGEEDQRRFRFVCSDSRAVTLAISHHVHHATVKPLTSYSPYRSVVCVYFTNFPHHASQNTCPSFTSCIAVLSVLQTQSRILGSEYYPPVQADQTRKLRNGYVATST